MKPMSRAPSLASAAGKLTTQLIQHLLPTSIPPLYSTLPTCYLRPSHLPFPLGKKGRRATMGDESHASGGCKSTATASELSHPEQGLKCPRCDSSNTKFCYYNNYSLAQPRHYCKTCRRYWTKGGALRNVPVGGGCRKNKRSKSSTSRLSLDPMPRIPESGDGLKFLNSLPSLAADFQIGVRPFSGLHSLSTSGVLSSNQCISFGDVISSPNALTMSSSSGTVAAPMMGYSYPVSAVGVYSDTGGCSSSAGSGHTSSSIASSIESLSSINQDLHWKLQQQRLAMFYGGQAQKDSSSTSAFPSPFLENQQDPISFEAVERSKDEGLEGPGSTKCCASIGHHTSPPWFVEPSPTVPITTTTTDTTMAAMMTTNNGNSNTSIWNGTPWPAWNDMPQFGTLP
ncbi:hypothetical protein B296_00034850 [Ensete ventricosum]|uniref:Dof zinc finger protein n=1 Tax=Ensete ventricosum TaxID=4639 RepID=A0A426ZKN2_ENSVE|nr:hypothetical protein B296_00034850 [Ensete ventricosum]